jgi:SAM-dependent methyltransferase
VRKNQATAKFLRNIIWGMDNTNISLLLFANKAEIRFHCERDVAIDSTDHIFPWGTLRDNSYNRRFNRKLYNLFPKKKHIRVLDLGCSGGGFVKSCIEDGHFAVGLEGSDWSKKMKRAEWATIPDFLFTCDITCDFELFLEADGENTPLRFDVVTSWDVLEHIREDRISHVARNVKKHLLPEGIWVLSIDPYEDVVDGVNMHATMQGKDWWIDKFLKLGFTHREEYVVYFNTQFVRGPKYGAPDSFHLVLSKSGLNPPAIPKEGVTQRLKDRWFGSFMQRQLKNMIVGE